MGEPTAERGFKEAPVIYETENGPDYRPDVGGGICAAATALHRAVVSASLKVVELHHHTAPVSYAVYGVDDAAVA